MKAILFVIWICGLIGLSAFVFGCYMVITNSNESITNKNTETYSNTSYKKYDCKVTKRNTKKSYKIVFRNEIIGRRRNFNKVIFEDGSTDTFSKNNKGFFLRPGDSVWYSRIKTPWMSVEKIKLIKTYEKIF